MSNTKSNKGNAPRAVVAFAAIDKYIERNIVSPKETLVRGKDRVEWGDGNSYPDYLLELYKTVPTLCSIVNGSVDFAAGDDVAILPLAGHFEDGVMNTSGDTIAEQVRDIARDYYLYGGFALQIIRDLAGNPAEIYYLDLRFVRTNKDCNVFYYNEDWSKVRDAVVYPKFIPFTAEKWATLTPEERDRHASSVLYVKNAHTQVYPMPLYAAAVRDCEIERNITKYHLNALENGFSSGMIVNFNNGQPEDQIKDEIERDFNEKFCGSDNAGRVMFSWNSNKDAATTFETPNITDFGDKYKALKDHSRQQIFASFRAVPALFGIMTESTGFNEQEFGEAFRLYNRTQIRPLQRRIADAYDKIYDQRGVLTIRPFSLDEDVDDTNVN